MRPTRALAVTALAAVLTLSACSSGGDDSGGSASAGDAPAISSDEDAGGGKDMVERGLTDGAAFDAAPAADTPDQHPDSLERAIISTGNVQLESDDVEQAVFDVQALVDKAGGEITDRETGTDDEGKVRMARLVLRIPAKVYSDAFAALEKVADLTSSSSTSEDVTTQLIDLDARIKAQRASLDRVAVLLDRAQSIRDIVAIESQLTRRQADLDSLVKRQAFLRDQTSMSTVTVNIQRASDAPKEKEEDEAGFFSGLEDGWNALTSFGTGLSTVAGARIPWSIALLIVGGLCWPFLRRFRGRISTPAATPDPTDV
jgi:hypothetical protein